MSTRRRFSTEFKAKVALEALRGDQTIQEIVVRHKVHPNQVRTLIEIKYPVSPRSQLVIPVAVKWSCPVSVDS